MPSRKAKRLFGSHSACPLAEIQRRRNVFRFAGELFSGLAAGKIPKRTILSYDTRPSFSSCRRCSSPVVSR